MLPGSGNAIGIYLSVILVKGPKFHMVVGGQGFIIKLRNTAKRSPTSMLLEPPQQINGSLSDTNSLPRWRHMK